MEYWDIYDIDRKPTGRRVQRSLRTLHPGEYRLVVHICIFSADGRMLIQRRQPFKETYPGMWDLSVGGSAVSGENSREAAHRELKEELGISHDFSGVLPHLTVNFTDGFDDIYLFTEDVEPSLLTLQKEEVEAVRYASLEEILRMIDEGSFIRYQKGLITALFEMREKYGTHQPGEGLEKEAGRKY